MIIIGSKSAENILKRSAKDIDIFSSKSEFLSLASKFDNKLNENGGKIVINDLKYEFQFSDNWPSCKFIEEQYSANYIDTPFGKLKTITPEILCLIKKSHLYRQINFYKHIIDFHKLWSWVKEEKNISTWAEFLDQNNNREIYNIRLEDTRKHFPDRTPSLAKTKEDFFNDYVKKEFIHDEIHFLMKHRDRPMYEFCQNGAEVLCDKELWKNLSYEDKISMVREEALVIALERKIIPRWLEDKKYSLWYKDGFYYAVMRICTNLCRGWFREFAQLNYTKIIDYDFSKKFDYFFEKVNDGTIKRITSQNVEMGEMGKS